MSLLYTDSKEATLPFLGPPAVVLAIDPCTGGSGLCSAGVKGLTGRRGYELIRLAWSRAGGQPFDVGRCEEHRPPQVGDGTTGLLGSCPASRHCWSSTGSGIHPSWERLNTFFPVPRSINPSIHSFIFHPFIHPFIQVFF